MSGVSSNSTLLIFLSSRLKSNSTLLDFNLFELKDVGTLADYELLLYGVGSTKLRKAYCLISIISFSLSSSL